MARRKQTSAPTATPPPAMPAPTPDSPWATLTRTEMTAPAGATGWWLTEETSWGDRVRRALPMAATKLPLDLANGAAIVRGTYDGNEAYEWSRRAGA